MDVLVSLTGWVGSVIEHTQGPQTTFATFRMASTPRIRRQGEWMDGETVWVTVTAFRQLADNIASCVSKGDPVVVTGKLRTKKWGTEDDPKERLVLEAAAVGHDLTRGTSVFKKTEKTQPTEDQDSYIGLAIQAMEDAANRGDEDAEDSEDEELVPAG